MSDDWFQSWDPPSFISNEPLRFKSINNTFFKNDYHSSSPLAQSSPNPLLTYMVALSLIKPQQKQQTNRVVPLETTGPFKTWYYWKTLDFAYPSEDDRNLAIFREEFIPKNNLPLGVEVYGNRIFISMPRWKPGVPATLAVVPRIPKERSPKLNPYPSWDWYKSDTCDSIVSVFRVESDTCGRLWVLDSGLIDVTIKPKQVCPPKVLVFDLYTDRLLYRHVLPEEFIKEDSLYSNILVDVRDDCRTAHAYLSDVWRYGIVVFSLEKMRSWRVTDHLFFPEPLAAAYQVHHLHFQWTDGIFGLSLSPHDCRDEDRILYFHPMSSFREFYVKTSVICNETGWSEVKGAFKVLGQSRGKSGHVSASRIDRNGIMFYNLVTRDSVGCWDIRKPYKRSNLGLVAKSSDTLVFPNDLKIDKEKRQSVWVLSNKLPFFIYEGLNENMVNFRIMSAYVDDAIRNTICDPRIVHMDTYTEYMGDEDCY